MQCNKVITGVNFEVGGKALTKSFLLMEPSEHEQSLLEVMSAELDKYIPVDSAVRNIISWATGDSGQFALLISLDSKYATLRELDTKGETSLRSGEQTLTFFEYPIEGAKKALSVLDREIGIYPTESKKFGYVAKANRSNLPRRVRLSGYGEFDPFFMAKLGLEVTTAPTGSLVWMSLLDDQMVNRIGGSPAAIKAELSQRLRIAPAGHNYDRDQSFMNSNKLTMGEVAARKDRVERYFEAISRLIDTHQENLHSGEFEQKLIDAVDSYDLAVELFIYFRFMQEENMQVELREIPSLLFRRMSELESKYPAFSRIDYVN